MLKSQQLLTFLLFFFCKWQCFFLINGIFTILHQFLKLENEMSAQSIVSLILKPKSIAQITNSLRWHYEQNLVGDKPTDTVNNSREALALLLTISLTLCNACWIIFHAFVVIFSKDCFRNTISAKVFRSRSGLTFCHSWSGPKLKLFAEVISRQQKPQLAS